MIDRRSFILSAATPFLAAGTPAHRSTPVPERNNPCGMNYDTGTFMLPGASTRAPADDDRVRSELEDIRNGLHCRDVCIYGSEPDRLLTGLNVAIDLGFNVRLQARINDTPLAQVKDILIELGAEAQRLSDAGANIVFDVGCELLLFADELVPGENFDERFAFVMSERFESFPYREKVNAMLSTMVESARSTFSGKICYSTTPDDPVDWSLTDIIGLDHYRDAGNVETYSEIIGTHAVHGKPIWINEFGACAYTGAADTGGMGWDDVVDWWADPPAVNPDVERNEQEQSDAIVATLRAISASPAENAFLYHFIEPGAPRSHTHARDYDLAGYGIVSCWDDTHAQPYASSGFYEPKAAYHAVAEWNANAAS